MFYLLCIVSLSTFESVVPRVHFQEPRCAINAGDIVQEVTASAKLCAIMEGVQGLRTPKKGAPHDPCATLSSLNVIVSLMATEQFNVKLDPSSVESLSIYRIGD